MSSPSSTSAASITQPSDTSTTPSETSLQKNHCKFKWNAYASRFGIGRTKRLLRAFLEDTGITVEFTKEDGAEKLRGDRKAGQILSLLADALAPTGIRAGAYTGDASAFGAIYGPDTCLPDAGSETTIRGLSLNVLNPSLRDKPTQVSNLIRSFQAMDAEVRRKALKASCISES